MKPRFNFQTFALVLCILALFTAQLFGMQRGYVCMCAGKAVLTQTTHCHGPHGSQCHASNSAESHSEEGQGSREEHASLKGDLTLRSVEVAPQFVAAPCVLVGSLPLFEVLIAPSRAEVPMRAFLRDEGPPPFGVTVARTIVFLI
ncbi:MAG: hypothetical protein JWL59_1813 [Chthoniobacteraceae bacterium]|nr:hypothetical protein [Chthoniobacteraceae bacterium]